MPNHRDRRDTGRVTVASQTQALAAPNIADTPERQCIDSLSRFHPVLITVDQSSLGSPLVRAALPGVVVVPRPGVVTSILLPLTAAGEVEGTIVRRGSNGIEGIDLELVDSRGNVHATTRTDFDGFFLFESVPNGQYKLRIAALTAQAANLAADLATVVLSGERPRARIGTLAVDGRAQLARVPPEPASSDSGL